MARNPGDAQKVRVTRQFIQQFADARKKMDEMARSSKLAGEALAGAFNKAKVSLLGFAAAGVVGTTQGNLLATQFRFLSREISQLFLPQIVKVTQWVGKAVDAFRELTGEQQRTAGRIAITGTALLGVVTLGPRVVAVVSSIGLALKGLAAVNPAVLLASGFAALMMQSEGGRETLEKLGTLLMDAFGAVAGLLEATVIPVLSALVDLLGTVEGQWAAFALVVLVMVPKMIVAVRALAAAVMTLNGAMALLAIVAAIAFSAASGGGGGGKGGGKGGMFDDLAKSVRSGRLTATAAKAEAEKVIAEERFREEIEAKRGLDFDWMDPMRRKSDADKERERAERAAARRESAGKIIDLAAKGGGRETLVEAKSGFEDVRATFKRLQVASLKMEAGGDPMKATAKATAKTAKEVEDSRKILEKILGLKAPPLVGP